MPVNFYRYPIDWACPDDDRGTYFVTTLLLLQGCTCLTANGLRKHWHQVRQGRRGTFPISRCASKEFVKVYCSPDRLLNSGDGESPFEELRASRCCKIEE
ncbi:Cytoplasmic FMR1-interacting protein [Trichinella spiralis]|uniref:Cytoplasmic FMR1-interacting protein n=1 Tax=Trichinella spiralis TaxID=6334 RepID=A0ABR3K7E3_TRISP